jgi:ABC-type multidrug transport system ATPase subunit
VFLNGLPVITRMIYLFAKGSSIKLTTDKPIYYSDVVSRFLAAQSFPEISFSAENLHYKFPNGKTGLRNIDIHENEASLIGIMGSSGAGKTTLLNLLTGVEKPTSGTIKINGHDLHSERENLEGVIGYIPQDDLLIDELTVYQNLFFNAQLCFKDKSKDEIHELVIDTLKNLDLFDSKDLKVGSPLKKLISGGQRKRLNIALELLREPAILFVDEPTSGLSSRDSENVMDLLRELSLKGKLIFVVIHQPSSEIYNVFDKIILMDTGGYMIFNGNPIEAISYFKKADGQINYENARCNICGNVNPEQLFDIVHAEVVDEYGHYTNKRKHTPEEWQGKFRNEFEIKKIDHTTAPPPHTLNIPLWFKQFRIFVKRDFLSKLSNRQYFIIALVEAPLLGFILTYIIRYFADPSVNKYVFLENENIPQFIFMTIIVAMFLGLTISAEEIFKDRKILRRESFLNLSRSSYLFSKMFILFSISAVQAILFVLVANSILEIKGMWLEYWFGFFTVSCFANLLGLNISSSFQSVVTIYILIPLLIIPQMILGGAMFSFDKLNKTIVRVDKVPLIAEFMASKWAYEGMIVNQFVHNRYEQLFYQYDKPLYNADYKQVYHIPELKERIEDILFNVEMGNAEFSAYKNEFVLITKELKKEIRIHTSFELLEEEDLNVETFSKESAERALNYLENLQGIYTRIYDSEHNKKEARIRDYMNRIPEEYKELKEDYYNEALSDICRKIYEKHKIIQVGDDLVRHVDPIFQDPVVTSPLDFRSHFLAPQKHFLGKYFDTYWFNMIFIWLMTVTLYLTLRYNLLLRFINLFNKESRNN